MVCVFHDQRVWRPTNLSVFSFPSREDDYLVLRADILVDVALKIVNMSRYAANLLALGSDWKLEGTYIIQAHEVFHQQGSNIFGA
jgi:hypothetical protein